MENEPSTPEERAKAGMETGKAWAEARMESAKSGMKASEAPMEAAKPGAKPSEASMEAAERQGWGGRA